MAGYFIILEPADADFYPSSDDYNSQSNDSDIVESSEDESHANKFSPITDITKSFVANKTPPAQVCYIFHYKLKLLITNFICSTYICRKSH